MCGTFKLIVITLICSKRQCVAMGEVRAAKLPKLLPKKLLQQHSKECKKTRCRLCFFLKLWKQGKPKWLFLGMTGKRHVGAGCASCAAAGAGGPWGNFAQNPCQIRSWAWKRHQKSAAHVQCAAASDGKLAAAMAPPMSEFSAAFQKMRQGGSARDGGVCSDKKVKMRLL